MQLYSQDSLGNELPKIIYCLSEMSPRKLSLREFRLQARMLFSPSNVLLKHSKLNPTWSAICHCVKFIRTELIENTSHVFELFLGTMLINLSFLLGHNQNNVTHLTKRNSRNLTCLHGVEDPGLVGLVSFVFTLWGTQNKRNLPH